MQRSMQIMFDVICVFLGVEQRFYPLVILRERNQTRLESSSEFLGFRCEVGCFSQSQSVHGMQRKAICINSASCDCGSVF